MPLPQAACADHPGSPQAVVLLGSTGSVGRQAIEVLRAHPDRFTVVGIAAGGANLALLAEQAAQLQVPEVAVAAPGAAAELRSQLAARGHRARVTAGPEAVAQLAAIPAAKMATVVLNAITGAVGLAATLTALRAGHRLALANKESLIIGGPLVAKIAAPGQITPVDSEHSALAQCLAGVNPRQVERLILTASGGPFRGWTQQQLVEVTPEQAMAHPTWQMGQVITTNSATLVNKGLEVIEAHLLFDIPFDRIDVVVHPQSIVHSMVEFIDGSTMAQCSPPDMRFPIALGLTWPDRLPNIAPSLDWRTASQWEFQPLDELLFPAVALARQVGQAGGTFPAVYNAANEVCVAAFHQRALRFTDLVPTIAAVVAEHNAPDGELSLESVLAADRWARARAQELLDHETLKK